MKLKLTRIVVKRLVINDLLFKNNEEKKIYVQQLKDKGWKVEVQK